MLVTPADIRPSQDYLKEKTVRFIFDCLRQGHFDQLPPTPFVRHDDEGHLVAVDGHNLIAVRAFLHEPVDIRLVKSPSDSLPETSAANVERNRELEAKFASSITDSQAVAEGGIRSFADLLIKYAALFDEQSRQ